MRLDLRPLLAGERLQRFEYEFLLDDTSEDSSGFLYGTSFSSPIKVFGDVTNTAGYIRLHLDASVDYSSFCARCLSEVVGTFTFSLDKTVATKKTLEDLPEDKIDDYAVIEDGFLDITCHVKDQLEMEFPSRFLCKEDCAGLCQRCGKNLNEGACGCPEKEIDPRLAPLQKILERMKSENNN